MEKGSHRDLVDIEDGQYVQMLSYDQSQKNEVKPMDNDADVETEEGNKESNGQVAAAESVPRQDSVVSAKSVKEGLGEAFTSEEQDVTNAGWNVMLKYFKVGFYAL